jgi:type VI secretion system (T6SS) effector Hcp
MTGAGPSDFLPPKLGHAKLTPMTISRTMDASTPALKAALNQTVFSCAFVVIGPTKNFVFASYTFERARITSFATTVWPDSRPQTEELALSFSRVTWRYQLRSADGRPSGPVIIGQAVTGANLGGPGLSLGLLMGSIFGGLIFVGGATSFVTGRGRRRARATYRVWD